MTVTTRQNHQDLRPTILIVDDTPDNIMLLSRLLKDRYNTKVANNGSTALQIAGATPSLDLILLDVMMPGLDGYETCRQLKANPATADIPVIFLTAKNQVEDEAMGLSLGAVDYIAKPVSPPILFARVATQLKLRSARRQLQEHSENLEKLVRDRTAQLCLMQEAIIVAMASMAETRDHRRENLGGNHIRTQNYVRALARHLQGHPRFSAELSDESVELMKLHAVYGRDTIMLVEKHVGGRREIAHSHQEKWDGSGYPQNLAGEQIPLSARLMAVADVYDALTSKRVYKPAFTHQQALDVMRKGRGTHFDPDVLDAFFEIEAEFAAIADAFADEAH